MRTNPPICAFCASAPVLSSPTLLSAHPATSPSSFRRAPSPPRRVTSPPKRRRPLPPVAIFNNNRNQQRVKAQTADLLVQAARFLQSPPGQIVLWAGLAWLVITGRIGFLFDSFLILFAVVSVVPVIAMVGFRWWINRQVVQGTCPSCGSSVTGLRGQASQCVVCGNTMQGDPGGSFSVKDPSKATIDIDAKEINDV